ncbi:MAG: hypothetical protein HY673_12395 [Chloroflexi bacterium]|nr:hypothetical protein [Chloroflexota bacterium]
MTPSSGAGTAFGNRRMARALLLFAGLLLATAATNCLQVDGQQPDKVARRLQQVQKEVPFKIILPTYLPEGFSITGVARASSATPQQGGVHLVLADREYGKEVWIIQWSAPIHAIFFTAPDADIKEVKGVPVRIKYGRFIMRGNPPQGVEGMTADWNFDGRFFEMTTDGVFWDEVEKIIASMME